jgi:hypothetical protein
METLLSRREIAGRIRSESSLASTGTLIIRTSDGHVAMLVLEKGTLIFLSCGRLRGAEAVPDFARINAGTCQFNHLQLGRPQLGLPPLKELLELLEAGATTQAAVGGTPPPSSFHSATPKPADTYPAEAVISSLAQMLIEYLGPIAPLLCKNLARQAGGLHSAADAEKLLDKLAEEIDDNTQRQRFLANARRSLEKFR